VDKPQSFPAACAASRDANVSALFGCLPLDRLDRRLPLSPCRAVVRQVHVILDNFCTHRTERRDG